MKAVPKTPGTHSSLRNTASYKKVVLGSCALLSAVALVLPAISSASSSVPASGSLYFSKASAKLVGDTALVPVECLGIKGSICSGELAIEAGGSTSEAPFSVSSGGRRLVSIPVSGAVSGASVVATAKSAQSYGGYATATEVLRLR